jgi:ribose transport system ATP-binding protein
MSTAALQARALIKVFPGVRAVDGVNLTLRSGEVHALLGENGAGKSTLIKMLTGVYRPDGGELLIGGLVAHFSSPIDALRSGVGVVHQERNVVPGFSIAENIALQHLPRKRGLLDRAAMRRQAFEVLRQLDIDLDPDRSISGLSAAQIQLVEIAKALSSDSKVLLLDEPTASITPHEADVLFATVRRLAENGRSVVFVSHKLEEVFALCDRVSVLRDGRSVVDSQPLADFSHGQIVDAMVGRSMQSLTFPYRPVSHSEPPSLRLTGLSTVLGHADVNLSVHRGEILGLYGLVGAGRSELARSLLGLHEISAGTIEVDGVPVRIRSVREAIDRHGIGYVPEDRKSEGVFLEQTVQRNIAVTIWPKIARWLSFLPAKAEREAAATQISALDIKISSAAQLAGQLSGGNQQKVSLAKWLAARPKILIIDEPTVGIDIRTKGAFHELIWGLAADGIAVLLISSDLPETITLADRILVLRDYRVVGEIDNDHDYNRVSQQVIRTIHESPRGVGTTFVQTENSFT